MLTPILDLQCRKAMDLLSRLTVDFDTPEARVNAKIAHVTACPLCRAKTDAAAKPLLQLYSVTVLETMGGEVKRYGSIIQASSAAAALMQYLADHDFPAEIRVHVTIAPKG